MMPFELPQPGLCLCFYGKLVLNGFNRDIKELSHNEIRHKKNSFKVMFGNLASHLLIIYLFSLLALPPPVCFVGEALGIS